MIFQKSSSRYVKSTFLRVGGSVWELKIDPKRLGEEIKNDIERRRQNIAARSEQTRPKRVPRRIWRLSLVDLEDPKSSHEAPKNSPRTAKTRPRES